MVFTKDYEISVMQIVLCPNVDFDQMSINVYKMEKLFVSCFGDGPRMSRIIGLKMENIYLI